jgi:hypothetical protein
MEPLDDPVLGHLEWDPRFNEWRASVVTPSGIAVELSLGDIELPAGLPFARSALSWLCENERDLRGRLAGRMLALAEGWRQENEPEITEATFADRVELTNVSLDATCTMSLCYADDDMFGGHLIAVSVSANHQMGDPQLWG